MDWDEVQDSADILLAQGICRLSRAPSIRPKDIDGTFPCNYLISREEIPLYIGEASCAAARMKVQFDARRSTFYKNHVKSQSDCVASILDFNLRLVETRFGRKEIEDFGIVNLPTPLNRFQLGKRQACPPATDHAQWDAVQAASSELIVAGAEQCLGREFHAWRKGRPPASAGIYIIKSSLDEIIYVGESSNVLKRFQTHGTLTYFSAVRRNLGTDILGYSLQTRNSKKRYFEPEEDVSVTEFLGGCSVAFFPVSIGRFEVEEHLIRRLKPTLNRKSNYR